MNDELHELFNMPKDEYKQFIKSLNSTAHFESDTKSPAIIKARKILNYRKLLIIKLLKRCLPLR